jgi:hypothetical protein
LPDLLRIGDGPRTQTIPGGRLPKVVPIVSLEFIEGCGLGGSERQGVRNAVVAVGFEILNRSRLRYVGFAACMMAVHNQRGAVQVVRCEVRP